MWTWTKISKKIELQSNTIQISHGEHFMSLQKTKLKKWLYIDLSVLEGVKC